MPKKRASTKGPRGRGSGDPLLESLERALSPFERKSRLGNVMKNWILFLIAGFLVMAAIQSRAQYDFSEADTLASETGVGCDTTAMWLLVLLPPFEEFIFRFGPYRFFGRKGAFVGSVLWAMLHVLGRNWAIVGFQLVMGMFYYKLVISGKYAETLVFHEAFNMIPLLTCAVY